MSNNCIGNYTTTGGASCGCKNNGILSSMDRCGMAHTVSLTAGHLLLVGAALLGSVGNALILASDADHRFYFICAEQVEFLN